MGKKVRNARFDKHKQGFYILKKIYRFRYKYSVYPEILWSKEKGWRMFTNAGFNGKTITLSGIQIHEIRRFFSLQLPDDYGMGDGSFLMFNLIEK